MYKMILRLKSGREFKFSCDEYSIARHKMTGELTEFCCEKVVGECPLYFKTEDVEAIVLITKEGEENETDNSMV